MKNGVYMGFFSKFYKDIKIINSLMDDVIRALHENYDSIGGVMALTASTDSSRLFNDRGGYAYSTIPIDINNVLVPLMFDKFKGSILEQEENKSILGFIPYHKEKIVITVFLQKASNGKLLIRAAKRGTLKFYSINEEGYHFLERTV